MFKGMTSQEADKIIKELESLRPFEDYKESFYNSKEYEEEDYIEPMNERDLKNDI